MLNQQAINDNVKLNNVFLIKYAVTLNFKLMHTIPAKNVFLLFLNINKPYVFYNKNNKKCNVIVKFLKSLSNCVINVIIY